MIRVGPAGWAYKDWEGIVYPKPKPQGFDPVAYLTRDFDAIEINSSFYGPPRPAAAKAWAKHAGGNPRFRFSTCEIAIENGATLVPIVRKWPPAPDEIGHKDERQN